MGWLLQRANEAGCLTAFQHIGREPLQRFFLTHVSDKVIARRKIDDLELRALRPERIRNGLSDSVGAAGDHGDLVCKFHGRTSFVTA